MPENNFFDDSLFDEEITKTPEQVELPEDDDETGTTSEPNEPQAISIEYLEIGKMFIGFVDESRAIGASLISGEPKEKYLFYKKDGKLSDDNEMVIAAAKVAQKYKFKFGPEVVLVIGLALSTGLVFKDAVNDKKKSKKGSKQKATKTAAEDNETSKPIE